MLDNFLDLNGKKKIPKGKTGLVWYHVLIFFKVTWFAETEDY